MRILAIETSCDETAAAVVEDGVKILSNVVASSATMHEKYGGIVPEVAAREQVRCIIPVIEEALSLYSSSDESSRSREVINNSSRLRSNNIKEIIDEYIDTIAITIGPGLIGSLLVGVETAKTLAFVTGKPIIPVNHVLAHMYANFLESSQENSPRAQSRGNIEFPAISLVVSGGHTELYLMKSVKDLTWLGGTLDDAAGEAFDKTARLLGFASGGGAAIQEAALIYSSSEGVQRPNREAIDSSSRLRSNNIHLPRPMINDKSLNFSFSGLKTAIMREVNTLKKNQQWNHGTIEQLAFEVQEAITDVLVAKTLRAAKKYNAKSILLSGGVAANTRLREKFSIWHSAFGIHVPEARLCTDNAAYIASYAYFRGKTQDWHSITAMPDLTVEI